MAEAYLLGRRRTLVVFAGLMLGMLLAALNQNVVATALPKIVADLGGFEHYSWVFSAYMLASTVTIPLYGRLSEVYGRRPLFLLAMLLFMGGCVVSGFAPSMDALVLGRAVQGLGAGGLIPLSMAVIGDLVAPRERGKWQGLTGAVFGAALLIGPVAGGWIADSTSWRWAFFVSLPFGLLALAVVWVGFTARPPKRSHSIDYLGAALLAAGVGAGLLAAVWGGVRYPWSSWPIIDLLVTAAASLAAFIWWELRAAEPLVALELFRDRTFASAQVALFVLGAAMFGAIMYVPLFVQGVLGESATRSGAILAPLILAWIATSVVAGQFVSRTGRYRGVLLAGPLVIAPGFFLLSRLGVDSTTAQVTRDLVVIGAGLGLAMQTYVLVVQNAVPQRLLGAATSATQLSCTVGATVGVSVMGAVLTSRLQAELAGRVTASWASELSPLLGGAPLLPATAQGVREALAAAMHPLFAVGLPLMLVAFAATLLIERRELRTSVDEPGEPGSDASTSSPTSCRQHPRRRAAAAGEMRHHARKKKERPPVSDLTMTLWVLAGLLATLLGTLWCFRMIFDAS